MDKALKAMVMVAQCWDAIEGEEEPAPAAAGDTEVAREKKRTARSKWMARRAKANELIFDYAGEEARGEFGNLDALADPMGRWTTLTKAYEGRLTDVQLAKMASPFYSMRLEEGGDIAMFLTAFQAKRNELNAASQVKNKADLIPEHAVFGLLLSGLPISLRFFVSLAGDVSLEQVIVKLRNFHDSHGAGVTVPASASAFYARPPPPSFPPIAAPARVASTRSHCRAPKLRASDHATASNWPHSIQNDRFVVKYGQCWTCLGEGHLSTGCTTTDPSLHRAAILSKYGISIPATKIAAFLWQQLLPSASAFAVFPSPPSTSSTSSSPPTTFPAHGGTFFVTLNSTNLALSAITPGDKFLFDTSATCFITPHHHLLHDYQPLKDTIPVIDAGGKETRAVGMGTLRPVCLLPNGSTTTFSISGVLHIPGFVAVSLSSPRVSP